jgi:hypothetical protein
MIGTRIGCPKTKHRGVADPTLLNARRLSRKTACFHIRPWIRMAMEKELEGEINMIFKRLRRKKRHCITIKGMSDETHGRLKQLSMATGKPMYKIVQEATEEYLSKSREMQVLDTLTRDFPKRTEWRRRT